MPGAPRPLLIAPDEQRVDAEPAPHQQRARSRRTTELVGADRHQVEPGRVERHRHVAHRRRGVGMDRRPPVDGGHHRLDRLERRHLVVPPLAVDDRRCRRRRRHPSRRRRSVPRPSTGTTVWSALAAHSRTAECSTPASTECVPRLRAAPKHAAAIDSVAPLVNTTSRAARPERGGHSLAGLLDRDAGGHPFLVDPPGVTAAGLPPLDHRRQGLGAQRRGGRMVEVVAAHPTLVTQTASPIGLDDFRSTDVSP